jgi:hypothetical protein
LNPASGCGAASTYHFEPFRDTFGGGLVLHASGGLSVGIGLHRGWCIFGAGSDAGHTASGKRARSSFHSGADCSGSTQKRAGLEQISTFSELR